jgi:hypothetical protein
LASIARVCLLNWMLSNSNKQRIFACRLDNSVFHKFSLLLFYLLEGGGVQADWLFTAGLASIVCWSQ